MAYVSNQSLGLQITLYEKVGSVLTPITDSDSGEAIVYQIDKVSIYEDGGVGSIAHQIERNNVSE